MKIYLRALELADAEPINRLRRIEAMQSLIGGAKRYVALERDREWIRSIILSNDQSILYFAVCEVGSDAFVGYTSVSDIDSRMGRCFWSGIKILPEFAGKGYGKETARQVLKYVFDELRMERCIAKCLEQHAVAEKMLEAVGFRKEGLMRHDSFKNGTYNNTWLFSILRQEYLETVTSSQTQS